VSAPPPAAVLRHRGRALLLDAVAEHTGDGLTCSSRGEGPWTWPEMLEGAAQTAGLLTGLQPGGLANTAVVAEYRDVVVHVGRHAGPLRFRARIDRRIMRFWRCIIAADAADGTPLLSGRVTLAPGPA